LKATGGTEPLERGALYMLNGNNHSVKIVTGTSIYGDSLQQVIETDVGEKITIPNSDIERIGIDRIDNNRLYITLKPYTDDYGADLPKTGWSDTDIFEVNYTDNIQIQIDRIKADEIQIRIWKLGDDEPFAVLDAKVPDRFFVVRNLENRELIVCPLERIIDEINRDRTSDWKKYDAFNWQEGWDEFVDGQNFELVNLEPMSREKAYEKIGRQHALEPPRPNIAGPIKDGEHSQLFTVLEIYEIKTWAIGYVKAVDTYVELKKYVEDDWVEYMLPSGEIADVQFSLNDDEQSSNYQKIEAFAYRTTLNEKDERTTDTDDCVRLI